MCGYAELIPLPAIRLDPSLPVRRQRLAGADAAHGIADDLIVQRRACPVAPIVYRPVGPDTEARRLPCCVDVRAEEQKPQPYRSFCRSIIRRTAA